MFQIETFILGLTLSLPVLIILYYFLYKEEYEVKSYTKNLEILIESFWYDIYEYKFKGKIKLFKWVKLIRYLLHVNLAKRLKYDEIPSKINLTPLKNSPEYKKIKKLFKMTNCFLKGSPFILNYKKYCYKILLKYKELSEKNERSKGTL